MLWWLAFLAASFAALWWIGLRSTHYTWTLLKPGDKCKYNGRWYTFPDLETSGPTYLLKDAHTAALRTLYIRTKELLSDIKIEYWVTGGTLMGCIKFMQLPMPFDDDVDIGVSNQHRKFLFSNQFVLRMKMCGIRVLCLRRASSTSAHRTGACVRLQLLEHPATLNIFFWKEVEGRMIKLDGWNGNSDVFNTKEQFRLRDVYPVQKNVLVDGLKVDLPANPANLLVQQYGPSALTKVIARRIGAVPHAPF